MALLLGPAVLDAKKKPQVEQYGRIAVTVFRDPGFALPGAEITLAPDAEESGRVKKIKGTANDRGEYVFRVPVTKMQYVLHAAAKGYVPRQKTVTIEGEETIDVTFTLMPESK